MGCFAPPTLPLIADVPIEAKPFTPCATEEEEVRVACVVDGDTLDLRDCGEDLGERIRFLGIDAPETEKPGEPAECGADTAWTYVEDLLVGQEVTVSYDRTCTDIFGRTLAYVWLRGDLLEDVLGDPDFDDYLWSWYLAPEEPAILLNEALLGLGLVRDYPEEIAGTLAFQGRLDSARDAAIGSKRGVWGDCGVTP